VLSTKQQTGTQLQPEAGAASSDSPWIIAALVYALALTASLNSYSLWTDEAFTAWVVSHRTLGSLAHSLWTGDSSDLQMGLYYVYLFLWTRLFGAGELALRTANIPFILIFSIALVWTSWRIFRSRVAWLAVGMLPFLWQYAAEARPYMALVAFSSGAFASLLGFMQAGLPPARTRKFPWLCLACIFVGSLFHMLFLLAAAPLLTVALLYSRTGPRIIWSQWIKPLAAFAVPFLALAAFFLWTFHRPAIAYDYPHPSLKSMASVFYELAGLLPFGPNRKFSIDFRPYAVPVALGVAVFLAGLAAAITSRFRNWKDDPLLIGFGAAALLAFIESVALSVVTGKQFDARHLAALVPVFLFLLIGMMARPARASTVSMILLGAVWLAADMRTATLPEYSKEDYRDAVAAAVSVHDRAGTEIVLAADPVAPAYYGLDVKGAAPCDPFVQSCDDAVRMTPWARSVPAFAASHWPRTYILSWLERQRARGIPVAVLVQLDRSHRNSPWWPILAEYTNAPRTQVHGFEIVLLTP
jgi:hypothetical protein